MLDTTAASQQVQHSGRREFTPGDWPIPFDSALALRTLQEAAAQARRLAHPLVVSIVQPVPWRDPLAIYAACQTLGATASCYWEQPAQRRALVGWGMLATLTADDLSIDGAADSLIQRMAARQRELLADAWIIHTTEHGADASAASMSGPVYFGGFAFDPLAPRTALWERFPAGALVLQRLLFGAVDGQLTLTSTFSVLGDEDEYALQRLIEQQAVSLKRLCSRVERGVGMLAAAPGYARITELQPAGEWQATVAQATTAIRHGDYAKVVLARGMQAQAPWPFDIPATLERLRTEYPSACVFAFKWRGQTFLGATPERLARVTDGQVETMALAGTAPRGATEDADVALGRELLASAKNREEHAIVAATVRQALAPLVDDPQALQTASEPQLLRLPNVQHLITPIMAALRPGVGALEVVAALHPTPAVGGYPRAEALAAIRACEALDRGWYAGPIGWVGAAGEGEFSVALRSALMADVTATLFAGCGIVADSDPQAEYAESQLKLAVMLRGLGLHGTRCDAELDADGK